MKQNEKTTMSEEDHFKLVNEVRNEAFQLILKRMEALGELEFADVFTSTMAASVVCFASVLRPAIERSADRASAADSFIAMSTRWVRKVVDPVVKGEA